MDLFGRKKKEKIEELQDKLEEQREQYKEKIQRLEQQAEKDRKRAQEAVTEKQQAEEELNTLKDKVRSLQDLLDSRQEAKTSESEKRQLSLPQVDMVIDNLEHLSYRSSKALTLTIPPERSFIESDTGEVVFNDPYIVQIALIPPLELEENKMLAEQFDTSTVRDMIDARYCFTHLSAGGSGAAFFDGQEMEEPVVIDSDVKSKHGKGGYSQSRFERIRQEQIEEHVEKVLDRIQPMLEEGFERLVISGNRELANELGEKIDIDYSFLGSTTSLIGEEDDLIDSFNSAMGWKLVHLPDDMINKIQQNEV